LGESHGMTCDSKCKETIGKVLARDGKITCPTGFKDISDRKAYMVEVPGTKVRVVFRTLGCQCPQGCGCQVNGKKTGYHAEFRATTTIDGEPSAKVSKPDRINAMAVMKWHFDFVYLKHRAKQGASSERACQGVKQKAKKKLYMYEGAYNCCVEKLPQELTKHCPKGNKETPWGEACPPWKPKIAAFPDHVDALGSIDPTGKKTLYCHSKVKAPNQVMERFRQLLCNYYQAPFIAILLEFQWVLIQF
jgi:hypothetical protein